MDGPSSRLSRSPLRRASAVVAIGGGLFSLILLLVLLLIADAGLALGAAAASGALTFVLHRWVRRIAIDRVRSWTSACPFAVTGFDAWLEERAATPVYGQDLAAVKRLVRALVVVHATHPIRRLSAKAA